MLFNLYSEEIIKVALNEEPAGITINGQTINNLRYADDTVIIAETLNDLQRIVKKLKDVGLQFGLNMNLKKTKYMIISKFPVRGQELYRDNTHIEKTTKYKYLGTWITNTIDQTLEIKTRIEMARNIFLKMRAFFCDRQIKLDLRTRMLRGYVFSTLLYGMEAWTVKQNDMKKLEAFEMWCYRRILKISWTDKVTNIKVLERMKKELEIIHTIKRRKLEYLGHVTRGERYGLLQLIIQGKILGRRNIGRRRISWLCNLREWNNTSSKELFRAAASKVKIKTMIANLLQGDAT